MDSTEKVKASCYEKHDSEFYLAQIWKIDFTVDQTLTHSRFSKLDDGKCYNFNLWKSLYINSECWEINIFKKKNQKCWIASNSWDPEQDQCFVGPDLGLNCLQRFLSSGGILKFLIQDILQILKYCIYLRKHCRPWRNAASAAFHLDLHCLPKYRGQLRVIVSIGRVKF